MGWTTTYVVLFDDLLETSIIQLCEFSQIMHIGDDIGKHLFQQQEILVGGWWPRRAGALATGTGGTVVETGDDVIHLDFASFNALDNLLRLALLEEKDLLEFGLEQSDEGGLIILGPFLAGGFDIVRGGLGDKVGFERFLEFVVGNVIRVVLLDHGGSEMLAEPAREMLVEECCEHRAGGRMSRAMRGLDRIAGESELSKRPGHPVAGVAGMCDGESNAIREGEGGGLPYLMMGRVEGK